METTDYCDYELSLALKVAGFDYPCYFYYTKKNAPDDCVWQTTSEEAPVDYNRRIYAGCSKPLLSHAQKWLREKKKIDVLVWNCACGYGWEISKADADSRGTTLMDYDDNGEDKDSGMWLTYENALSAGITVALELIEQENK